MKTTRIYLYPGLGKGARYYLTSIGTVRDLHQAGVSLREGMRLHFYDIDGSEVRDNDNLLFEGTVHFDAELDEWYAMIDWDSFRHESDEIDQ